jgi:hypothetical protein
LIISYATPANTIYPLTMSYTAGGTVTPSSGNYLPGNTVTINAIPNTGYVFIGWTGMGQGSYTGNALSNTITMNGAITENAFFANIYVPVTLTNSQSSATVSGLQQMLNIPSSTYSSYINSGWSNVEFTASAPIGTAGNVPLYAWIETNAINTATSTTVWVNLGTNTIAAYGNTLTIYMNFLPSNVMTSNTAYTGEAPQLETGTCAAYGSCDNGALVFPAFYDNFVGTVLSAKWTQATSLETISNTVSNGITLTATNSGTCPCYAFITTASATFYPSNALRALEKDGSSTYPGNLGFGDYEDTKYAVFKGAYTSSQYDLATDVGGALTYGGGYGMDTNLHTWDTYWGPSTGNFYVDGILKYTSSTNVPSTALHIGIGDLGNGGTVGSTTSGSLTWIFVHAYPPVGTMPSVSFGSVA